jgi:hypothetical protein
MKAGQATTRSGPMRIKSGQTNTIYSLVLTPHASLGRVYDASLAHFTIGRMSDGVGNPPHGVSAWRRCDISKGCSHIRRFPQSEVPSLSRVRTGNTRTLRLATSGLRDAHGLDDPTSPFFALSYCLQRRRHVYALVKHQAAAEQPRWWCLRRL